MVSRISAIALILLMGTLPVAHSDEVVLDDGSKIMGTITGVKDGVLTIKTKHAGDVSIKMSGVEGINSDGVKGLTLGDETPLKKQLKIDGDQQVLVDADGSSETVDLATVALLWPGDKEMPPPVPLWSGRVEFGLTGTDGNSDRFTFNGRSDAVRDAEKDRLLLFGQGHYAEVNNVRSQNELKAGGRYEWKISDVWNAYTSLEFEHDEFEGLDLRSTAVLGMGYRFIKSDRQFLLGRAGVGYQHENYDVGSDEGEAILDLGYDYELKLKKWAKLRQNATYQAGLEDPIDEYRVIVDSSAEFPLSSALAWKLRAGVKHEYDDAPLPGVKHLDTTYYLNLGYDW